MRWHQIVEDDQPVTAVDNISNIIKNQCHQYLAENPNWKTNSLFRGMEINSNYIVKQIRKDRRPLSVNPTLNTLYDNAMAEAGFVARRSNSIYCSGRLETAFSYGDPFVIFPIGNFNFSWSPMIADLFRYYSTLASEGKFRFKNEDMKMSEDDLDNLFGNRADDIIKRLPKDITFAELVKKVPNTFAKLHTLLDKNDTRIFDRLDIDTESFADRFENLYRKDNLPAAMKSENEIMISGDSYLAVSYLYWSKIKNEVIDRVSR